MIAAEAHRCRSRFGFTRAWTEISLLIQQVRIENKSILKLIHIVFYGIGVDFIMACEELHGEVIVHENDAGDSRYCSGSPRVGVPFQDVLAILIFHINGV